MTFLAETLSQHPSLSRLSLGMWECWDLELEGDIRDTLETSCLVFPPLWELCPPPQRGSFPPLPPHSPLLPPPAPPLPHPFPVPDPVEGGWRMSELVPPHSLRP